MKSYGVYNYSISAASSSAPTPYMGTGIAYIMFAKQEPELFKLLFMRDRTPENQTKLLDDGDMSGIVDLIVAKTGLSRETALKFHTNMWIYVHGLAIHTATGFFSFDDGMLHELLYEEFEALSLLYTGKKVKRPDQSNRTL